jgi:predicted RNA-binding protein YlqC (UPF0109 family)
VKDLLTLLVRGLVRDGRRVRVQETSGDGETQLVVEVSPGDRGRVIGRGGRTVEALRTLMGAVAERRGTRCTVEVVD